MFNVSDYIERCAVSLLEQTLKDIEYIFIDDNSTDNTLDILHSVADNYPLRRDFIRVIKMDTNSGTSVVRSLGIKEARGEYIIHCDSDDWVDADYFEKLYNKAITENADIVIGDFKRESIGYSCEFITEVNNPPIQMLRNMHKASFYCMLWNKLMRRSLLMSNSITTKPGINMWEDVLICLPSFYYAKKIAKIEGAYYHYWINPKSYTQNSANEYSYTQRRLCINELEKFFADKEGDWSLLINYWKLLAKSYMLTREAFDPDRWKREYPEANNHIMRMKALSIWTRIIYKITSISSLPIKFAMK